MVVKMSQADKKIMSIQFPSSLLDKMDEIGARLERPRAWLVKQAVTEWLDREEEKDRLTREALADVDMGAVVDHTEVMAWAERLK